MAAKMKDMALEESPMQGDISLWCGMCFQLFPSNLRNKEQEKDFFYLNK